MTVSGDRSLRRVAAFGATLGVAVLLTLVFGASAFAVKEYEPNDTRETAAGPLEGGKPYTATFETDNDVDWYVFYIKTYSQMDFTATEVTNCDYHSVYLRLLDKDGKSIESFSAGPVNQVNHLHLTMEPGRYYFEVRNPGCSNENDVYRFQIDPAASITPSHDCGEAIVAKGALAPQVTKVTGELGKNDAALAKAEGAVKSAKDAFFKLKGQLEATLRRLKRTGRATPYRKRRARNRVAGPKRRAIQELAAAKESRAKVLEERAGLQALEAQNAAALSQAEGQIAATC
jgi:hypothetical protein